MNNIYLSYIVIASVFIVFSIGLFWHERIISLLIMLLKETDLDLPIKYSDITDVDMWVKKRLQNALFFLVLIPISLLIRIINLYVVIIIIVISVLIYKIPYIKLKRSFKRRERQLEIVFPSWLRQLQILLQNNNVLVALQKSIDSAPELIRNELIKLIQKIELDSVSIEPFLSFFNDFEIMEVQKAMKFLYRYNSMAKEESYAQFNNMIVRTSSLLRQSRLMRNEDKVTGYRWVSMLPLIACAALFMLVMLLFLFQILALV